MTTNSPTLQQPRFSRRDIDKIIKMLRPGFKSQGRDVRLVDVQGPDVVVQLNAADHGLLSFDEGSGVIERVIRSRISDIRAVTIVR